MFKIKLGKLSLCLLLFPGNFLQLMYASPQTTLEKVIQVKALRNIIAQYIGPDFEQIGKINMGERVVGLSFSPSGNILVSCSDKKIVTWDGTCGTAITSALKTETSHVEKQ